MTLDRFLLGARAAMAASACVGLLALAALAGEGILVLEASRKALEGLPALIERQAREQGSETRIAAIEAVQIAADGLQAEVSALRVEIRGLGGRMIRSVDARAEQLVRATDERLAEIQRDLAAEVALTRIDLKDALDRANHDLSRMGALAESARRTTEAVGEASEVLLDPTNVSSLPNKAIGFMQAGERAARVIAEELPATAEALRETSQNVAVVTERFAKPSAWWQKVLSGIGSFATGYNLIRR